MDSAGREEIVIIDDDIIVIENDEDTSFQNSTWNSSSPLHQAAAKGPSRRLPSCVSLTSSDDEPPTFTAQAESMALRASKSMVEPQFRTPDYGPRNSRLTSRNPSWTRSLRSQWRLNFSSARRSSAVALSPTSNDFRQNPGTVEDPAHIDPQNDGSGSSTNNQRPLRLSSAGQRRSNNEVAVRLGDEMDIAETPGSQRLNSRPQHNFERSDLQGPELVDLDVLEDDQEDELRILAVNNIGPEEEHPQEQSKAVRHPNIARRNPSIVAPWRTCPSHQHKSLTLKPNKTVELLDGDFLRIRDVILNTETKEVRIRGNRLQRTRDLNGLLERKMNEVVLFLEVDLDDRRPHLEQAAVEVPLTEIKKLRSVRLTNQKFPLDRNLDPAGFGNRDHINLEGGLTCRWKYTCIYATGVERHNNIHKERRLERLRVDECTSANFLSDADCRLEWRGETVLGGAYDPAETKDEIEIPRQSHWEPPISIESSPEPEEKDMEAFSSNGSAAQRRDQRRVSKIAGISSRRKRTYSFVEILPSKDTQHRTKRSRSKSPNNEVAVEETRRHLSTCTLQGHEAKNLLDSAMVIDITSDPGDSHRTSTPSEAANLPPEVGVPESIDLLSSNLSSPPPSGSVHSRALVFPPTPIHRLPGQKLTYGDAFCGGGGSTRGALMAGLHIKWGFDFNIHAYLTWKANFPDAACYRMSAHDFVSLYQTLPPTSDKDPFKVDILHLSPPCQFFSPAHTVEGQDDEMNIASLFAVRSVIEVAKPRVVTLEQTFGIVNERFRWFFNALIQMFTSHEFSVRWAVIPLAQWGLPQRRMRLIIISSCPGEILPRMPDPTHTENPTPGSNLKPYVSVDSALNSIPPNAPDHDLPSVHFPDNRRMPIWDSTKILPRAMTTSGGQNYHPSGRRGFTLREYACLQGFPNCHVFRGNYVKKQIGNAVPPVVAKVLFESVKRDLDRADGVVDGLEVLE